MKKLNRSGLRTYKVGRGRFGAKTMKLMKFKPILEKHNLIVPPHTSFSEGMFAEALIKAGVMTADGRFTGEFNDVEFDTPTRAVLGAYAAQFRDRIIAIRSDEHTAKGVGVFHTEFLDMRGDFSKKFKEFLYVIKMLLQEVQFEEDAETFKQRMGLTGGIGIQVMPLMGIVDEDLGQMYPPLSIAGYTAIERNQIILHIGYGVGGAVSESASTHVKVPFDFPDDELLPFFDTKGKMGVVFDLKNGELDQTHDVPADALLNIPKNFEMTVTRALRNLVDRLKPVAQEAGDIYFEAQSLDVVGNQWAITQIDNHEWTDVQKPDGEEILYVTGLGNIIGSAIVQCNGFTEILLDPPTGFGKKKVLGLVEVNQNNLTLLSQGAMIRDFATFGNSAAIIQCAELNVSRGGLNSHTQGVYREVGIPILAYPNFEQHDEITKVLSGKRFIVWANELTEQGGIVIPK